MKINSGFPWFFYLRVARLSLVVFIICAITTISFLEIPNGALLNKILPIWGLTAICYLVLLYFMLRPLGLILSRVSQLKVDIPFERSLNLLYQKDEWAKIDAALNQTDLQLKNQIHQIKTENEKIAAILESIYDDIIAIDNFETVLFYNSNFKRHFMRDETGQEIQLKLWHLLDEESLLSAFRQVLSTGTPLNLKGLKSSQKSAKERFFDLTVTALRSPEGKITGALGVFYDMTEVKLTEQMRVDFVANVSHEIRTPLTSIKGYTQLLDSQKGQLTPDLQLFIDKIVTNTERMIDLFNDLLQLTVIESKSLDHFGELNLNHLFQVVTENIQTNYPNKKLNFSLNLVPLKLRGDVRLMEQVFSNLIDNACKYSKGEIFIRINSYCQDAKGVIKISDNGIGIPPEHLPRIFERFYRVDSSREASRGTGLGLSIVKHIISKHGGKIWAESDGKTGTSFFIELPLA